MFVSETTKKPLIYLITEGTTTPQNLPENEEKILYLIKLAVLKKIQLVQIREKEIPARFVYEIASKAAKIAAGSTTKILVNDRADIALSAKANGVHLTSNSIPTKIIRQNFPKDFIIGVSAHSFREAQTAAKEGADFATFSPIFATPSKEKYGAPQGLEKLSEVCELLRGFPIIALGGIDEANYKRVLENGASGFAAIRFLNSEEKLKKLTADLRRNSAR